MMKSPNELREKLKKQWLSADHREQRLADNFNWPIKLPIGKPSANDFKHAPAKVREHLQRWRDKNLISVEWLSVKYQSAANEVETPAYWCIHSMEEWITACHDKVIRDEYDKLNIVLNHIDKKFHCLLIRQRSLWQTASAENIIQCCELAMQLKPGIANGRPLRALSIANIDSKFIENNRALICRLLNISAEKLSLEKYLGAAPDNDHWLLIIPLDSSMLPFKQLRLTSSELATLKLPGSHLIIIENERCAYQLPRLKNTLAILGAGLNLNWLENPDFQNKKIAYWGDIDSWGLKILASARKHQNTLTPLLMTETVFEQHQQQTVNEPQIASEQTPRGLTKDETALYKKLIQLDKGRLEQEFIEVDVVHRALFEWH